MPSPFAPAFEDLPQEIPIFPLTGALLLPQGKLPLNIFEPRYLNMTMAALSSNRMIGMIQPSDEAIGEQPAVYETGCLGRITSFNETEDGRFLISLDGICRFHMVRELPLKDGYRRIMADYQLFRQDMQEQPDVGIDRDRLLAALRRYLQSQGVDADWGAIEETSDERLITSLAMMCPFQANEKQALLEAPSLADRSDVMVALLEMTAAASSDEAGGASH